MSKSNVVLTIPEPGRIELVERPYPNSTAGYAVIRTEIAPVCLEGSRIWAAHDFEFHDDPTHILATRAWASSKTFTRARRSERATGSSCSRVTIAASATAVAMAFRPLIVFPIFPDHGGRAMHGIEEKNDSESGGFAMARYRLAPIANLYRIPDSVDFRHAAACNCSFGVGFSNQE